MKSCRCHFQLATTQLRFNTGKQHKKFLIYSLFGWILPLTLAVITVLSDLVEDIPDEYKPGKIIKFANRNQHPGY